MPLAAPAVAVTGTFTPLWHPVHAVVLVGKACAIVANAAMRPKTATAATGTMNRLFMQHLRECVVAGSTGGRLSICPPFVYSSIGTGREPLVRHA